MRCSQIEFVSTKTSRGSRETFTVFSKFTENSIAAVNASRSLFHEPPRSYRRDASAPARVYRSHQAPPTALCGQTIIISDLRAWSHHSLQRVNLHFLPCAHKCRPMRVRFFHIRHHVVTTPFLISLINANANALPLVMHIAQLPKHTASSTALHPQPPYKKPRLTPLPEICPVNTITLIKSTTSQVTTLTPNRPHIPSPLTCISLIFFSLLSSPSS